MFGVFGTMELFLPASHSLKDRRRILKSMVDKLRIWNISVIDASEDGIWQRGRLQFALVTASLSDIQERLDSIDRLIGSYAGEVELSSLEYDHFV